MKNAKLFFIGILLLIATKGYSQSADEISKDKIEAQRISFITAKLDLTPSESQVFWPLYNQYRKELEAARKEKRDDTKKNYDNMSDAELNAMIEGNLASDQKEIDIKKKYYQEFKKILSVRKIAKLYRAEKQFLQYMLNQLNDKH